LTVTGSLTNCEKSITPHNSLGGLWRTNETLTTSHAAEEFIARCDMGPGALGEGSNFFKLGFFPPNVSIISLNFSQRKALNAGAIASKLPSRCFNEGREALEERFFPALATVYLAKDAKQSSQSDRKLASV
jgi:hypothetical protein